MIRICGPKGPRRQQDAVNTTSRSKNWSRELSPFFLGPIKLYRNFVSQNMENAWQYSKVYQQHIDWLGEPSEDYWNWAMRGWAKERAVRYPMGKGAKPAFSYWDGEKLDYISARKRIYIPLYARAVKETQAFAQLRDMANRKDVWLWDFDGYDHHALGMSLDDVIECETRKMGHAFVLAMLLEGGYDYSLETGTTVR